MFKRSKDEAPENERGGLVSHLLLRGGDVPEAGINVSWVEVGPGSAQDDHTHDEEQAYLVVSGRGRMRVGEEETELVRGDLVHVPASVSHGLANGSEEGLVYVTVATASNEEVL